MPGTRRTNSSAAASGRRHKGNGRNPGRASREVASPRIEMLAELLPQLARAIGPLCELVLHEKSDGALRIRAIANNHISHRTVGGPAGVIVYEGREIDDPQEPIFNYSGLTEDRKRLRCSVIPIRAEGEVIGAICVNFLVHDLQNAADALGALLATELGTHQAHAFVPTSGNILDAIVESALRERGRPPGSLTRQERLDLIATLRARGALNVRGAIGRIAFRLGISRTAVYNYLKEIEDTA